MKKYLKRIGNVLSILSLAAIVYAVWKLGLDFSNITNIPMFVLVFFLGVIGKTVTVFISGSVWNGWVSFFARKKGNWREALRVYTKANTGKYLPGNVMHYVERNLFADKMGVGQKKIAVSSLIEVVSFVLVAFTTAFFVSFHQLKTAIETVAATLKGSLPVFFIAGAVIAVLGLAVVVIVFRKKVLGILKEYSMKKFVIQLFISMLGQLIVLTTLGLIFVMLYLYMGGNVDLSDVTMIVAGYIISWVLGFVVIGAPGGIGIRELVLTLLVGSIVGKEIVLTIALIHRLITIIGDFLAYLLGMIFLGNKEKESSVTDERITS